MSRIDMELLRDQHKFKIRLYKVYAHTKNQRIKALCTTVRLNLEGEKNCLEKGLVYPSKNVLHDQQIEQEYTKLRNKGVLR